MTRVVVDVGASVGLFSTYIARRSSASGEKAIQVFAIEPIPEVAAKIKFRENLKVMCLAVAGQQNIPISGKRTLKRTLHSELSTLGEINPQIDESIWSYHLPLLEVISEIQVECKSLEEIFNSLDIVNVDFLKIDTQGTDLEVLMSAGRYLKRVKALVIECPYTNQSAIYTNETELRQAITILGDQGFVPVRIVPNGGGECNVFFMNSIWGIQEYFSIELDLGLEKAPTLKIGKHNPYVSLPMGIGYLFSCYDSLKKGLRYVVRGRKD